MRTALMFHMQIRNVSRLFSILSQTAIYLHLSSADGIVGCGGCSDLVEVLATVHYRRKDNRKVCGGVI